MKRSVIFLGIIVALAIMTGCAKIEEEVNAVVYDFWTQWHGANEAKLASLMTDEVDFGFFVEEKIEADSKTSLAENMTRISASDLATIMITTFTVIPFQEDAFTIAKTSVYTKYAVVNVNLLTPANEVVEMLFHLIDTDEGWKICLVGLVGFLL